MDAGAWNDWAPTIADATGDESCTAAFDERMEKAAPALFNELDESTRQDGITDDILDRVAPSALGNAILILEVFGKPTQAKKAEADDVGPSRQQTPPASAPMSGRGRGRFGGANQSAARTGPPPDALEVSIGVYSIRDQQVVASMQMHPDAGESADALRKLSEKLRETLHGVRCAGWTWQSSKVAK